MSVRQPIHASSTLLPFRDPQFKWWNFESFWADFLRAKPVLSVVQQGHPVEGRVISVEPLEVAGESQHGIDLRAKVQINDQRDTLQEWVFQCKHTDKWTAAKTRTAVEKAEKEYASAHHYFLLVTCELGFAVRTEAAKHEKWTVWSQGDITGAVRGQAAKDKTADVIRVHFGARWAETISGLSGDRPLVVSQSFFEPEMDADVLHHHRAALLGRENELAELHDFLKDDKSKVLIFPGAGGSGKSRLLKAFAESVDAPPRGKWSVRFYINKGRAVTGADMDAVEGSPLIVVDDAHREDLGALLNQTRTRPRAKLILATRPQAVSAIRQTLSNAGIDASRIGETKKPLRRLSVEETEQVVRSLIGPGHDQLVKTIADRSADCLLIAVVASELVRTGEFNPAHPESESKFEQAVFRRLIDDRSVLFGAVREPAKLDRLLQAVALLAPVPREGPWLDALAAWVDIKPYELRDWMAKAEQAGMVRDNKEGIRLVPDVLADHLLFHASYDHLHRPTGFVDDFLQSLHDEVRSTGIDRALPNLAEAEWRARWESGGGHGSVVGPFISEWRRRFADASYYMRCQMLHHWSRFGVYLPEHTLTLVEDAIRQAAAGRDNEDNPYGIRKEGHRQVLVTLPPILKEVALYHDEHRHRCFDLLWEMGVEEPEGPLNDNRHHTFANIIEVARYGHQKPLEVSDQSADWMVRHFQKTQVIERLKTPVWWFSGFLSPFFDHSYEVNEWVNPETLSIHNAAVVPEKVWPLRRRILALIRELSASGDESVALNCLAVLDTAAAPPRVTGLENDKWLQKAVLPLRGEVLEIIQLIVARTGSGFVHWRAWQLLHRHLRYELMQDIRSKCWDIFESLPDSFELRLVRATCSDGTSEITSAFSRTSKKREDLRDWDESLAKWQGLCEAVAAEVATAYPTGETLHAFLAQFVTRARQVGFRPLLGNLLVPLALHSAPLAEELADAILSAGDDTLHACLGGLVDGLCPVPQSPRVDLAERAARSSCAMLQQEAARMLVWWQRQKRLPESGKELVYNLSEMGAEGLQNGLLREIAFLPAGNEEFCLAVFQRIARRKVSEETAEALALAMAWWFKGPLSQCGLDLTRQILEHLVQLPSLRVIDSHQLQAMADRCPGPFFWFLRQRIAFAASGQAAGRKYRALPDLSEISLRVFAEDPAFEGAFASLREDIIRLTAGREAAEAGDDLGDRQLANLRRLARNMLESAGSRWALLLENWLLLIRDDVSLDLFIDLVITPAPAFVLKQPGLLHQLMRIVRQHVPSHAEHLAEECRKSVSRWVGESRRSPWRSAGEGIPENAPDPWEIVPQVEKTLGEVGHIPELQWFYQTLLEECKKHRAWRQSVEPREEEGFL